MTEDKKREAGNDIDEVSRKLDIELDKAINNVSGNELQEILYDLVENSEMTPAFLCISAGGKISEATGLQLLFVGLETTREIVDSKAWKKVEYEPIKEDIHLIAADLLVTLGFERLIEHQSTVTKVINNFGVSKAKLLDVKKDKSKDVDSNLTDKKEKRIGSYQEENLVNRCAEFLYIYKAAINIAGSDKDHLFKIAQDLALYDCLKDKNPNIANKKRKSAQNLVNEKDDLKFQKYFFNL